MTSLLYILNSQYTFYIFYARLTFGRVHTNVIQSLAQQTCFLLSVAAAGVTHLLRSFCQLFLAQFSEDPYN